MTAAAAAPAPSKFPLWFANSGFYSVVGTVVVGGGGGVGIQRVREMVCGGGGTEKLENNYLFVDFEREQSLADL